MLGRTHTLIAVIVILLVPPMAWTGDDSPPPTIPAGLESFLEGCILEAGDHYPEAASAYAEALAANPESNEVAVRYATVLHSLGQSSKAMQVLQGRSELDWYGLRVRALALTSVALREPGRLPEARIALRAAVEERTDDPNLMLSLVQVEHSLGDLAAAEEVMRDLRSSRSSSTQLISYHANLLRDLDRHEEALELYEQCVDAPVVRNGCRESMVESLVAVGRPGDAGELLQRWLGDDELDDLVRAAILLSEGGRSHRALNVLQRVLAQEPNSQRALTVEAVLLSGVGRYQEATARFQRLLRKDPESLDLLLPLAWAQIRSGDRDGARQSLGRAWEVVQHDAGSRQAMALCLTAARVEIAGDHALVGREWLDRVADPSAAGPEFVRLLAETYRRTEQWQDGVAAMLRLQPKLEVGLRQEAVAFEAEFRFRGGDSTAIDVLRPLLASEQPGTVASAIQVLQMTDRWEDVERECAAALERMHDEEMLLFARAAALERLERHEESSEVFERLIELDPENDAAANYLGYMWADQGANLDRALELIVAAVGRDPENPAYLDSLGWVHFRRGDAEKARYWLRRAVDLGVPDGTVFSHLGEALLAVGDEDGARPYLEQALSLGCENPDHVQGLLDTLNGEL